MSFDALAYAPDESLLVTIGGTELLAHDAETEKPRWRCELDRPVLGVVFAASFALPAEHGNPWRTASSERKIVAVDSEGTLHVVEPTLGQAIGKVEPVGRPTAIASTILGGSVAVATQGGVVLWRRGERHELMVPHATALAFSAPKVETGTAPARLEQR